MFPMQVPGAAALVPADRINDVEPRNRPLIDRLRSLSVVEHSAGVRDVRAAATTFLEFWEHYDVLVPPTAGIVPPPVRCVDIFFRPDGTFGFEEFRRDPEDMGAWTRVAYYSGREFESEAAALAAARDAVPWVAPVLDNSR
jgi:hypothetical protein